MGAVSGLLKGLFALIKYGSILFIVIAISIIVMFLLYRGVAMTMRFLTNSVQKSVREDWEWFTATVIPHRRRKSRPKRKQRQED